MPTFFILLCCIFSVATVQAAQTCKTDSIPASTPNSQLVDNGDGTVTDSKTGLMWKQCLEGISGTLCENNTLKKFTWQEALQRSGIANADNGFAGYTDWRLPNIRELRSLVEEQCSNPAINLDRFPNTPSLDSWSGSLFAHTSYPDSAWIVNFYKGNSSIKGRENTFVVRLVRSDQ